MKIAVASMGNMVAEHFGHCEAFTIYVTEGDKITEKSVVPNPGHRPGFLPNFLGDMGVEVIISGGMGGGAIAIFDERNIEVIMGNLGLCDDVVAQYLAGNLKSMGSACHKHEHHDECSNH